MEQFNIHYDSKERFNSYWTQVKEVTQRNPRNILEVGIGNAFVSSYLRRWGYNLITLDVCRELQPDFAASVTNLPFKNKEFDVIICCEVLEHLPYSEFGKALQELNRVSSAYVVLSLPDSSYYIGVKLKVPYPTPANILSFPALIHIRKHVFEGEHFWEIGINNYYSLRKVEKTITCSGFDIEKTYRIFENPFHRMFILKKF